MNNRLPAGLDIVLVEVYKLDREGVLHRYSHQVYNWWLSSSVESAEPDSGRHEVCLRAIGWDGPYEMQFDFSSRKSAEEFLDNFLRARQDYKRGFKNIVRIRQENDGAATVIP